MSFMVSSTISLPRLLHFRPSSNESECCKLKEHRRVSGGGARRISHLLLHPLNNSSQFRPLSSTFCTPSWNTIFYPFSSPVSLSGRSPRALHLDSPITSASFSCSTFLNSLALTMVYMPRKRTGRSRAESLGLCRSSLLTEAEEAIRKGQGEGEGGGNGGSSGGGEGDDGGGGGDAISWISSTLVFAFWAGLIGYAWTMAPNQTHYRDIYFIEKLLNLRSDDGFTMNRILVAEWYIMGCWPILYSSLLIPSGRSRKNGVKVGPFAVLSFFVGAFALLPYFGLWRPPPPAVSRDELSQFPLNILESKITAVAAIVAGIVLAGYAGFSGADQWTEFFHYVQESRFIHVMSIDFVTLSVLAPFWVYNDLSVRQGSDKVSWLLPLSVIPYLGPALYLCLRPPPSSAAISDQSEEITDTTTSP